MGKVIVTGGGGFIASHLIDKLLRRGDNVIAFDVAKELPLNLQHQKENKNFRYMYGDITDSKFLHSIMSEDVEIVYHLASVVGVKNYCLNPLKTIDVNILGTKRLIEEALKKRVKILFTSTSEIYGKNPAVPWKEDSDRVLGNPSIDRWVYSTTKSVCEHMLNAVYRAHGLPMIIVRYFNVYGPRQAPYFIIPATIHRVLNGKSPVVYDGGGQTRCFTFIDDVIEGTIAAANNSNVVGKTFNIGSSREEKIIEVINIILKFAGKWGKLKVDFINTEDLYGSRYEDLSRRVPDTKRAQKILGWGATISLEEGVKKTIRWAMENDWWVRAELAKEIG